MNNNMTPTPWKLSQSPTAISSTSKRIYKSVKNQSSIGGKIIANAWGDKEDEANDNAKAIILAVNATYGNGINPEAVKEMRDLLERLTVYESDGHNNQFNTFDQLVKELKYISKQAKASIDKAKL